MAIDTLYCPGKATRAAGAEFRGIEVLLKHRVVTGVTMAFRAKFRDMVVPIP